MSAVHANCQGCGKKTSVAWVGRKLLCADCRAKAPAPKPKGTVEK